MGYVNNERPKEWTVLGGKRDTTYQFVRSNSKPDYFWAIPEVHRILVER